MLLKHQQLKLIAFIVGLSTAFYCQQTGAAVLAKDKMWPKHSQLVVVFLDGTPQQKKLVKKIAPLWLENSSLSFHFYNDFKSAPTETHIRVSFKGTTGSVLGNHGDFSSQQPTLQLAKLNEEDLPENFAKRWILHEFGHALGFEHEFRNPDWPYGNAPIEQQISACYPGMIKLDYSEQQARTKCREINQVLSKYSTNSTIYDEYSIMNYPMEIAQGKNISKKIHARFELSVLDKLAIERWYGK